MKHLFKIFTIVLGTFFTFLVVGLALSTTAWGQLLNENFDYSTGALTLAGGANVSGGNWINFSGTANFLQVTSGSLSYTGYPSTGIGNKVAMIYTTASAEDARRPFTEVTSGAVYASLLLNVTNSTGLSGTTGDYVFAMRNETGTNTGFKGLLYVKSQGAGFALGVRPATAGAATSFFATELSFGTTYLIVVKYLIVAGGANDVVSLWVNPDLSGPEPVANSTVTADATSTEPDGIDGVALRQATNTPNCSIDGIRVDVAWSGAPLPVQLASFVGYFVNSNDVTFEWETISEVKNYGFWIQKRNPITDEYITIEESFQPGQGVPSTYKWTYANAVIDNTEFYLLQQDNDGLTSRFGPIMLNPTNVPVEAVPSVFALNQNYPNPFNPSTVINYQLAVGNYTTLKVYNIIGKEVATLVNGNQAAGYHQVTFNASQLSNGIYFYKLQSGNNVEVRKLTLMK